MADTEHALRQEQMSSKNVSSQILLFSSDELQVQRQAEFLWVSEKYFLQGICQFILFSRQMPQRATFQQGYQLNCVFNDIIRLDFTKFKSVMAEYKE